MIQTANIPYLWNHSITGDVITASFDVNRKFLLSIKTQVLKLASRFACQNSKEEVSCLLVGSCNNNECDNVKIDIDRIECDLASYLSDNQLLCSSDICVPLKIYKNQSAASYIAEDYIGSFNEYIKHTEDYSTPLLLPKVMFLKAYAGFSDDKSKNKNHSTTLKWIEFKLLIPDLHLTLSPINKVPIFRSALISSFENHVFSSAFDDTFTFGYLSIDQSGKVHFFLHSDERAITSALVGIWVHGASDVTDVLVVAACMKYIAIEQGNKICKPPFPFMLAQFTSHTNETIRFYDVKWPKGTSGELKSPIKDIGFKLISGAADLDRYYQSPNETTNSFVTTLSLANKHDRGYVTIFSALKTVISRNYTRDGSDDTVPRSYISNRSAAYSATTSEFQGLEVSDVSLLVNEVSVISSSTVQSQESHSKFVSSKRPTEARNPSKLCADNVHVANNQSDEAIPRPLLKKPHLVSSLPAAVSRTEVHEPRFQQVQFMPQPVYPYPALYPANPYIMFPPNMCMYGQDRNMPVVSKPPPRPKPTDSISHQFKESSMKSERKKMVTKKTTEKISTLSSQIDRAVITDVTNTSSKRILQLDREEDLATLEHLVQQIINQRHDRKPKMVSTGVNTTPVMFNQYPPQTIEVSTDLPSFMITSRCHHCGRSQTDSPQDKVQEEGCGEGVYSFVENNDKENSLDSSKCEIYSEHNNVIENLIHKEQDSFQSSEESLHYDELLNNLEEFVKQSKNIASEKSVCDISHHQSEKEIEISNLNVLEEAVKNLRELDVNRDFESQYWETLRNSTQVEPDNCLNDTTDYDKRDSLDATILQRKINYVSIFLNSSSLSPASIGARNSLSEQSIFIESLARKYLHKASSELERIGLETSKYGRKSSLCHTAANGDYSVSTRQYLHKHNLMDDDRESDTFYSSIRMPNGNPLPKKKLATSSTPALNRNQSLDGCKKSRANQPCEEDSWSGLRILAGLNQQPSILAPRTREPSHCWPGSSHAQSAASDLSSAMVLDLDKLRLLPKYL